MQFANYWQQFEHTGRVEDYLNYLQSAEREGESHGVKGGCTGEIWRKESQSLLPGRMNHAGIPVCNRNGIKTDTIWRI